MFNSDHISIKKLRSLSIVRENVHDHRYCWQNDCETLLRSKNILPNQSIKNFKIVKDKEGFSYSFLTGMPSLSDDQIYDRNKQLYYWKQDIERLEEEAKESI